MTRILVPHTNPNGFNDNIQVEQSDLGFNVYVSRDRSMMTDNYIAEALFAIEQRTVFTDINVFEIETADLVAVREYTLNKAGKFEWRSDIKYRDESDKLVVHRER